VPNEPPAALVRAVRLISVLFVVAVMFDAVVALVAFPANPPGAVTFPVVSIVIRGLPTIPKEAVLSEDAKPPTLLNTTSAELLPVVAVPNLIAVRLPIARFA
jgi:hypothetical protein